jgi:hypothetical protein
VPEHGGAVRLCVRLCGYREYSRNVVRVIHRIVAVELTDRSVHGLVIMAVTVIMVLVGCGLNTGNVRAGDVDRPRHLGVQNRGKQDGQGEAGQQCHA